mgnify:CR=1 FL=1|tara:strand:+ start:3000 stop:3275 length:276 start_codon:yes stop_codon:yes gene_type:complete
MNHNAIYATHSNVVSIDDTAGAMDKDGNPVKIDQALVNAWVDPNAYKYERAEAYKPIAEQLDMQYHDVQDGSETWLDHIKDVKAKYPKGDE